MSDARFEDGGEAPLRLAARDAEDVPVISTILQDAVFHATEMAWDQPSRRFAILLNRFRWEDKAAAESVGRDYERVRALFAVEDVLGVSSQGIDRTDPDTVLSVLNIAFVADEDTAGQVLITLAGDGAIRIDVDALNLVLRDVTLPYAAPSGQAPDHGA